MRLRVRRERCLADPRSRKPHPHGGRAEPPRPDVVFRARHRRGRCDRDRARRSAHGRRVGSRTGSTRRPTAGCPVRRSRRAPKPSDAPVANSVAAHRWRIARRWRPSNRCTLARVPIDRRSKASDGRPRQTRLVPAVIVPWNTVYTQSARWWREHAVRARAQPPLDKGEAASPTGAPRDARMPRRWRRLGTHESSFR